jgi:tRNA-binding protein
MLLKQSVASELNWSQFLQVEMRVGTVLRTESFPEAKNPAYIVHIDFGGAIGTLKSSAQVTDHYSLQELVGRQVAAVVNFPAKQIGPMKSQCLVLGAETNSGVVLISVDQPVPNGTRIA